jgi:hypothetical protein
LFFPGIFTRERDDVSIVIGVVESNREIGPALLGLVERNRPAREIASRDFKLAALSRHEREDDGVRFSSFGFIHDKKQGRVEFPGILRMPQQSAAMEWLGNGRSREENNGNGEHLPTKTHRYARLIRQRINKRRVTSIAA